MKTFRKPLCCFMQMAMASVAMVCISCSDEDTPAIQTEPQWFETATHVNKDFVDVLYFAGTNIDHEYDASGKELLNILLTEPEKAKLADEYETAYTLMCPDSVNFFAPYYHQGTMTAITSGNEDAANALNVARKEVLEIYRYYMKNLNGGRPFILAGFSQGAVMVQTLLWEMSDEEYARMKAAYMIGFGIADAALQSPHVKPATGEFDKGVTISFNSATTNADIWSGVYANTHHCINPVNWKTDETPASFTYDGMTLTNHIDLSTHVLLVDGFDFVTHPSVLPGVAPRWTEKNLHVYEVRMYAPFLRKNIKNRAYRF